MTRQVLLEKTLRRGTLLAVEVWSQVLVSEPTNVSPWGPVRLILRERERDIELSLSGSIIVRLQTDAPEHLSLHLRHSWISANRN